MGVLRDFINKIDASSQVSDEIKETLSMLKSLAEAKGTVFVETIEKDLLTGKTIDNLNISITKVIETQIEYRVLTQDTTNSVIDNIKNALSKLFTGEPKILDAVADIINSLATAIMGAGEGQELEKRSYAVVAEYPAIVRYDFAMWGRTIKAESVKTHVEQAFTCVAYKSAVDVTKLAFNDFLALYGPILRAAYGSDQAKMKDMIQQAQEIYSIFIKQTTSDFFMIPPDNDVDTGKGNILTSPKIEEAVVPPNQMPSLSRLNPGSGLPLHPPLGETELMKKMPFTGNKKKEAAKRYPTVVKIKLTQETVLKHFMERSDHVPVEDNYWQEQAKINHQERGGTGTMLASKNTLLLINPDAWWSFITGDYFGVANPNVSQEIELSIPTEFIDRIITTEKQGREYVVIQDVLQPSNYGFNSIPFIARYVPNEQAYMIVHFVGID